MEPLRLAHLWALATWGGVVLAELIVEIAARDDAGHAQASRLHFWIDVLIEVPLLITIVATGSMLLGRTGGLSQALAVKLGCAFTALTLNAYCVFLVVLRHNAIADPAEVRRLSRRIRWTGAGIPFGLAALWIGLTRFHAW